jgi:hypothetical protein
MSITIHPDLESRLRARAEIEGLTVEAYVERIARDDQQAEEELEALALGGLDSGESIPADEALAGETPRAHRAQLIRLASRARSFPCQAES